MSLAIAEDSRRPKRSSTAGILIPFRLPKDLPDGVTPDNIRDTFPYLNGFQQEGALLKYIGDGQLEMVNVLRLDMHALEPLDTIRADRRVTSWTWQAQNSPTEITPENQEHWFDQLHRTFPQMDKENLSGVLERERQRAIHFAGALFAPAEDLGTKGTPYEYTAARRYFTFLSEFVRSQTESVRDEQRRIRNGKPVIVFDRSARS